MIEYIRRSQAEEAIEEYICRTCKEYSEYEGGCISHAMHCPHLSGEEILKPVESEDVQPVKRGKWEFDCGVVQCSCCKLSLNESAYGRLVEKVFDYCPKCGAKMDRQEVQENA